VQLNNPISIGRIARPVGVNGDVKVYSISNEPEHLTGLAKITVALPEGFRKLNILRSKRTNNWLRMTLEGIETREDAYLLSGCEIVIASSELPKPSTDEYYIDDLIGCRVIADDDTELGIIKEVMKQGHHDLWVIDGYFGEILVPAVKEYIVKVDVRNHLIVIRRIEGLWEES